MFGFAYQVNVSRIRLVIHQDGKLLWIVGAPT